MRLNLLLLAITLHFGRCLCNEEAEQTKFANSWAVHVDSLDHDSVDKIATKHGFINRGQIGKHHGYYLFERKQQDRRRERRDTDDHTELLMTEPKVNWAEQQRILERSKRNVISSESRTSRDKRDMAVSIQDPFYKDQWYLQNIGQSSGPSGLDINVLPVWGRGFSGQGIVVSILDDGVDHTHPDLRRNYDPNASFDFNDFDTDPSPRTTNPLNRHGTRCAGEIAAEANNGICGVGVSFNASIGGIRMLDGAATDVIEGLSLGYRADYIDIYTCCWGPKDDGKRFGKPGFFASRSLEIGAEKGRGGKGNIFVWATGNGGLTDDDCNCDGYTTSIYTVSIGAISDHGLSTYYTETCASTIAVTFSGASHREADENKIITTDLNHKCTKTFKGTSSAAPLASGMLALVLEANPNLSWRDVQHIIVETSQKTSPLDEGWKRNGAGKLFNHKFGFGKLDTTQMVNAALNWKPVAKHRVCNDSRYDTKRNIPSSGSLILSAETSSCEGSTSEVRKLEHVQVVVSLKHRRRGDLSITLISPSGTRSQLLKTRRNDKSTEGLTDWVFMTVHCWGENPKGSWSLVVTDNDRNTREHHVIKAKQGDMEDVERVVMDDSEKRGNWDSRVVNEYERPKNASPGNETKNDHILKNMEDTTGELVKGNKFVELAKRKKNRKKVAEILKTEKSQTDHARNASKVPKNHQFIKTVTSYRAKVKYWHRKTKHMKRFWNRHNKGRKWNRKHRKMKSHREKLLEKAKHKTYTKKASKNNTKKLLIANTKMSSKKQWSLSKVKGKPTNLNQDKQLNTSMPVGRLESSTTTASATKSDLQAIASPLIQKIIGISRTANFVSAQNHQSLVGEVNIKMKLFGNSIKQKDTKAADHADSSRSSVQYEHRKHQQNPSDASLPVDIYAKLLRSVESMRRNSSESDLAKEQQLTRGPMVTKGYSNESVPSESHLNETSSLQSSSTEKTHPGSSFSGSRLNGTESTSDETGKEPMPTDKDEENSADINHKPFIFYDNDSKKYVALGKTDASKNVNSFVIVGEGSGSGSGNQDKPEKSSDINEKRCGESQDGNCEDDYYRNIDLEESDEDAPFKKLLKDQNTTKQPEDDFGDVDKFKLSKIELYPPEEESKGFGKIDGMSHIDGSESGDLPENGDFSESKELDSGNKVTGNDAMNNYTTGNDETGTGNPMTENIDYDMHNYSRKEYQSGRKLSGGNGKYQSEDSSLMYNNDTQKLEEQTKPPPTGNRISKTGSESIRSENINIKANDINIARDENTRTGIKNAEKVDGNAGAAKANAQEVDERPGTEIARTEKAVTGRASARKVNGNSRTGKASSENANDEDPLNWGLSDSEAANLDLENNESKNETSAIQSAKETDQENKINDDFGDMGSDDYQDLELRKRYQKLRSAMDNIYPINSSSFEEMIKKRLEEEYGVDNTSTSENIESSIPKNDSFEGERIEHENQVTDDVSSSDFSGNEISGSGNGKNTEYEIIDLADVKDDIGGYVGESQNHSVNSSAENNFASGDGKQESEQQNVTQQRVTEKSMSEEKVPIDVSLNKSKDTNPEGSTPDQGQDLSGPIPNKVHVDNDAPTIYEPAAEEKDTMNEAEPTQEEVKQPEQLNKDAPPVYLDEAPKDGAPIELNGDPEQIGNDYQESENDDSEKQERTLEAMRTENSKKIENQEKPEDGFLQRVKEDIKQKKIGDLEKLEKVLKRRMSKAMHGLSDEDSNAILKAVMSEKLPEDSDSQRLVRRGLAKAPSKANDQVNQLTNEPSINKSKQEHSGILESWSLIFYGT